MIRPTIQRVKKSTLPERASLNLFTDLLPGFARSPALRLSPTAWAKLLFLRDAGETEVGGFGISAADDLLYVENVQLVRQTCDVASVAFDDESVADYFDRQVDAGRTPSRVGRIWLHTHPGSSPEPSATDEETFARVFGRTDWAVLFILARGGKAYARLQFHVGPGGSILLPVEVDYRRPFAASDHAAWSEEYFANVEVYQWSPLSLDDPHLPQAEGSELGLFQSRGEAFDFWDEFYPDDRPGFAPQPTERRRDVDRT